MLPQDFTLPRETFRGVHRDRNFVAPCSSCLCIIDFGRKSRGLHSMEFVNNRHAIQERQLKRLQRMLQMVLPANEFYRKKFSANGHSSFDSIEMLE